MPVVREGNSSGGGGGPPPPNPVLTAYESYCRDTPLITRYVLNATMISYLVSFIFSPAYLFANIPQLTIFNFQLYRVFTSPLICENIITLFFTFMGFMNHGVRLEQSMGSTLFAVLFFTLAIGTNILFLIIAILLWGLTNSDGYLMMASLGIWTVLLGIIAVECSEAPPDTKRRLFFFEVQALYYPLVLLALFSMFAGPRLSYFLGVGVGYAYGHGKLDRWKVRVETVSYLFVFVWIQSNNAVLITPCKGEEVGKQGTIWMSGWVCTKGRVHHNRLG